MEVVITAIRTADGCLPMGGPSATGCAMDDDLDVEPARLNLQLQVPEV